MRIEEVINKLIFSIFRNLLKNLCHKLLLEVWVGIQEKLLKAIWVVLYVFLVKKFSLPNHPFKSTEDVSWVGFIESVMIHIELFLEQLLVSIRYFLQVFLIEKR